MNNFEEILLKVLLVLLVVGYVAINFIAKLPPFLVGENLFYAIVYFLSLYRIHVSKDKYTLLFLSIILSFNAGRVSRSVIEPTGVPHPLAIQHVPLLIVLVVTLLCAVKVLVRYYSKRI